MKKIQKDFIGLWVSAGGYIARPIKTNFKERDLVKTHHFGGSTKAGVGKNNNCGKGQYIEYWITTGISVYELSKLKKTIPKIDLEKYMKNAWEFYQGKSFDHDLLKEWTSIKKQIWA